MLKYYILINSNNSPSEHNTKMEQYAGEGTEVGRPTDNDNQNHFKTTYSLVALMPTFRIDLRKGS